MATTPIPYDSLPDDAQRFIDAFPSTLDPTLMVDTPINISTLATGFTLHDIKHIIQSFEPIVTYDFLSGKVTITTAFFVAYKDKLLCFQTEEADAQSVAQFVVDTSTGPTTTTTIASNGIFKAWPASRLNVAMKFLVSNGHLAPTSTSKNFPYLFYTVRETPSTFGFAYPDTSI